MTIEQDIRIQMIGTNNTTVLSDDYISLLLEDATSMTGTDDTLALRYYTCYLIATNWETIGAVASREGVSFREPNPQKFLDLYNARMTQLSSATGDGGSIAYKISTNSDLFIDEDSHITRRVRESDED